MLCYCVQVVRDLTVTELVFKPTCHLNSLAVCIKIQRSNCNITIITLSHSSGTYDSPAAENAPEVTVCYKFDNRSQIQIVCTKIC